MDTQNIISNKIESFDYKNLIKLLSVSVISMAIGIAGGATAYSYLDQLLPSNLSNYKMGYQSGYETSKKLVESSPFGNFFQSQSYVKTLSGKITAVGNKSITIQTNPIKINPFEEDSIIDRTVLITDTTKIIKLVAPDAKLLKEAQERVVMIDGKPSIPIVPLKEISATLSDIKKDDNVSVTSSVNIKNSKEFTATEIKIQPSIFGITKK